MKTTRLMLAIGLAALLFVYPAWAAQRTFVSGTGSDANACSVTAPCRTFQRGIDTADAGGEVVVLDSAGYGSMTINKSVQVIVPPGVHAGITAGSFSNGVTVNAGPSDVVTLRGIYITRGDTFNSGILFLGGGALFVENCVIEKFSTGIDFQPTGTARLSVKGTVVRNSGFAGILVLGPTGGVARATVERSWLENVQTGVDGRDNSIVLVLETVATGNSFAGFVSGNNPAGSPARLTVENSAASNNTTGIRAAGSPGGTTVVLSNNVVTDNIIGLTNDGGTAVMESRGNNTVRGNGTNVSGVITTTFSGI
jgi:Right handed beta helix region